jgi:hypothetical protein
MAQATHFQSINQSINPSTNRHTLCASKVRVGLEMNSGRFGIVIRWQHLKCTIFAKTLKKAEDIEGFEYLEAAQQAEVSNSTS